MNGFVSGREIASVATSPIQDGIVATGSSAAGGTTSTSPSQRRTPNPKGHVRFLDIQQERESSESETENTVSVELLPYTIYHCCIE